MNLTKQLLWGTLAALAAHGLSSCSDNDSPAEAPSFSYEIVANAQTAYGDTTKAAGKTTLALTESAGQLLSAFQSDEKLLAFNLTSDGETSKAADYSQLTPNAEGWRSHFTGTVTGKREPRTTDNFAFFYPGTAATAAYKSVYPVQKETKTVDRKQYILYNKQNAIRPIVELDLTHQDGTLATISKKFDYQWSTARPKSITGTTANIEVGKLQRKIAIWGLRFTDENNVPFTNIDSVNISEVKGSEALDLNNGEFIGDNDIDETWGITLQAAKGAKFTSAGGKYTYAALLPGNYKDVIVTVYVGNKIYQREYPALNIAANHFYKTDILKMQEVRQKPYVTVAGIKWATGNFIRYTRGGQEYWGIAPVQWWISKRDTIVKGVLNTTQFVNPGNGSPDDKDHFRYGDIRDAHKYSGSTAYQIAGDLKQKYFKDRTTITEVTRNNANYGDVVWFHTELKKDKYRLPSYEEWKQLMDNASTVAAYCYSDKGLKIYGAYFYDTPQGKERVQEFPVGARELTHFKDVSNLVRANKGLFLPIAGWVSHTGTNISYKVVTDKNAVGKYLTSTRHNKGLLPSIPYYEFGMSTYHEGHTPAGQARPIRPVWVQQESSAQNPTHPHFVNLK